MEYTYDDIITAKDILTGRVKKEDIIGKTGWFMDSMPCDMSLDGIERESKHYCLRHVELNWKCPFFADDGDGGTWTYFLPEKEESAPIPRFKIGDRVKIVKEWDGFVKGYNPTIGETGRIEEIDEYESVKVVLDSDGDFWWYRPDSVELIEDKAALSPVEGKDKPAYIPFDLSKEEDRNFLRGKWIKQKDIPKKTEMQIIGFRITEAEQAWCCDLGMWVPAEDLLSDWVFLDGSPCGRQMASK